MTADASRGQPEPVTGATKSPTELRLTIQPTPNGDTRVDLMDGERSVSWLWIVPFTLRIGAATVRMDGIGGVGTEENCRHRGYSRRVLEATVEQMRQGDAALSMLYGITDFYPKFGYATAGPDHRIELTNLSEPAPMPAGWWVRPFTPADLPTVRRLYDHGTAAGVGAAVRSPEARCWSRLAAPGNESPPDCRVIEDSSGEVHAYAWRARWHWYVDMLERDQPPNAFVLGEVMADGPASADALLAACRAWAVEAGEERVGREAASDGGRAPGAERPKPIERVLLALPPEGHVAAAAMHQSARFVQRYTRCGSSMARVLDVYRLLEALKPELARRLQAAGSRFVGTLLFRTDLGDAALTINPEGIGGAGGDPTVSSVSPGAAPDAGGHDPDRLEVRLPQTTLARLALGAFPPGDLLDRLEVPVDRRARALLEVLFPLCHPHMHLPDRF